MGLIKVVTWVFIFVVGGVTGYLAYLNRASDKVATNLPQALAVAVVGALLALLYSLRGEERSARFPVEYVIDPVSHQTYSCEFFPPMESYADPSWGTGGFAAYVVLDDLHQSKYKAGLPTGNDEAVAVLYRDVLLRQMLDTLRFTFLKSWDAEPARFNTPTGGAQITYAPRVVRPGVALSTERMIALLDDPAFGSHTFKAMNLPPNTHVVASSKDREMTLTFTNQFVTLSVVLGSRGVARGVGKLQQLCRLSSEDAGKYRRPQFEVRLEAKFSALRAGNPDMPLYAHWVDVVFSELQQFDARQRWDQVARDYSLLYTHRTESPLQELMRETIAKANAQTP